MQMDLAQLRAFVAIADAGGVSRAAERLHLSQPALSRQLQTLEAALGIALFDRTERRLRLTPAGEDLLRRSRIVLDEAETLRERARALQAGETGVLKVGATPPMIEAPLAGFLATWRKTHPGIEIRLVEDGGTDLAERLHAGNVHVAYVPAGDARFHYQLLYPIHVVAAVAKDHELARSRSVELKRVAQFNLMALRSGFGSRDWFDTTCRGAGIHPTLVFESASHNAVLALAAAGYGVGILPSAVSPASAQVRLLPIVHDGLPVGRWTMIAWSRRRHLPAYAETFIEAFSAYARQHYPGRDLMRHAPRIKPPEAGPPLRHAEAPVRRLIRRRTRRAKGPV
ncbi:MAG TPA: LysR family transcriptional regulator [Hyphomicrobiaceae bacterium]|nr:LysR family transcriptional regulator [Hyphomicrobiaceae bacterium]